MKITDVQSGADPSDIHMLRRHMDFCGTHWARVGLGAPELAGIEAGLWNLKGKPLGLPVYELLGGRHHDRLLAYVTGGVTNWAPDRLKAKVDFYQGLGYRAFEVSAGYYDAAARRTIPTPTLNAVVDMESAKAALMPTQVGPNIGVLVDGHMGNPLGVAR